jgi:hypothetical protein
METPSSPTLGDEEEICYIHIADVIPGELRQEIKINKKQNQAET